MHFHLCYLLIQAEPRILPGVVTCSLYSYPRMMSSCFCPCPGTQHPRYSIPGLVCGPSSHDTLLAQLHCLFMKEPSVPWLPPRGACALESSVLWLSLGPKHCLSIPVIHPSFQCLLSAELLWEKKRAGQGHSSHHE